MTKRIFSFNVLLLAKNPQVHFRRADFCQKVYNIARRMEDVSAPGEAYNSRKSPGKVRRVVLNLGKTHLFSYLLIYTACMKTSIIPLNRFRRDASNGYDESL